MEHHNTNSIEGNWQGVLKVAGNTIALLFTIITNSEGHFKATLINPNQGKKVPASKISFDNEQLYIQVNPIGGEFKGIYQSSSKKIIGTWSQAGQQFETTLERINEIPKIKRPQEPVKPYPYIEEEVHYNNIQGKISLSGILTYPKDSLNSPAVILISGSGALDRDETIFGHKPFLVLADYLTKREIAVLRVDDRGVGETTGNYFESTNSDFSSDVIAGINYLKTRKEINRKSIGLIGHSEGGVIAPLVASTSTDVSFIVLMAGPGLPLEQILYKQGELIGRSENLSEDLIIKQRVLQEKIFSIIKKEKDLKIAKKKLEKIFSETLKDMKHENLPLLSQGSIEAQIKYMLSPWFRDFLTYDPKISLTKVHCPVLALNGEKDLQVPAKDNLTMIKQILKSSGNINYKVEELKNLNHLFQTAKTGALNEYSEIEETISPLALKVIGDWIIAQCNE
jgi:pimeloyl-ACP methyl ester carboxylesterase